MENEIYEGECSSIFDPITIKPKKKLYFKKQINVETGTLYTTGIEPKQYNIVRHVTGNIYLAWDKSCPQDKYLFIDG